MKQRALAFILIFILILIASYVATLTHINPPQQGVRPLGHYYLNNSYFGSPSAKSPEAVTAIVWDYRGLDTLYETTVFFLAVIGGLTIFRIERTALNKLSIKPVQLTIIVKLSTKLLVVMIVAVSASIALHGHLTPGGGFQGGSALAIAPLLIIAAYSRYVLEERGVTYTKAVALRSIGLTLIWLVVILPLVFGYYIMQNQPFYPSTVFNSLVSGSLSIYNILECVAVGMGFTALFLYLSLPEEVYRRELESEVK